MDFKNQIQTLKWGTLHNSLLKETLINIFLIDYRVYQPNIESLFLKLSMNFKETKIWISHAFSQLLVVINTTNILNNLEFQINWFTDTYSQKMNFTLLLSKYPISRNNIWNKKVMEYQSSREVKKIVTKVMNKVSSLQVKVLKAIISVIKKKIRVRLLQNLRKGGYK